MRSADPGLAELAATVDTVIAIPNDRLLALAPRGASLLESFKVADDILRQSVQGMSDIMLRPASSITISPRSRRHGVLINITGSSQLGLHEVNEACATIRQAADCDEVQINFGVSLDESMGDAVTVTVIATGFQPGDSPPVVRRAAVSEWESVPVEQPVYEETTAAPQPEVITSAFDSDDLDTPAYLRQGKMLN
ncbi:MAG: hypothetical protein EXQ52_19075 [Bryobacterales bacterium]|nr:hypothetical protein [Bryobacterales bacterium]